MVQSSPNEKRVAALVEQALSNVKVSALSVTEDSDGVAMIGLRHPRYISREGYYDVSMGLVLETTGGGDPRQLDQQLIHRLREKYLRLLERR